MPQANRQCLQDTAAPDASWQILLAASIVQKRRYMQRPFEGGRDFGRLQGTEKEDGSRDKNAV